MLGEFEYLLLSAAASQAADRYARGASLVEVSQRRVAELR